MTLSVWHHPQSDFVNLQQMRKLMLSQDETYLPMVMGWGVGTKSHVYNISAKTK